MIRAALILALLLPAPAAAMWKPRAGVSWQLQLSGKVDTRVQAHVFDFDLLTHGSRIVRALHARHRRVVCYFSAGSNESFRSADQQFPLGTLGERLRDYPDERWLDIRRLDELKPLIERRLDRCRRNGYDGVDFDNVDGYANQSGFPLTASDQMRFNGYLAGAAHARGLAAGLKNDLGQVRQLAPKFEFAVNEQCFQYHECATLQRNFVRPGKPVFQVEYNLRPARFCARANRLGFSSLFKRLNLGAYRVACR